MSALPKVDVNPLLLAALEHYSGCRYDPKQPHFFVQSDARGHKTHWSVERTTGMALRIIEREPLMLLKFEALRRGLVQYGMGGLYERIMGEKIESAAE